MADTILLNWPKKKNLMDKIIGDEVNSIVIRVSKMIFICEFNKPLITHNRMVIVVPPLAELEDGFSLWMHKIISLAQELSNSIVFNCDPNSQKSIQKFLNEVKIKANIELNTYATGEEIFPLKIAVSKSDLLVIVTSRKGSISYNGLFENLSSKLDKSYPDCSKIILYPYQKDYQSLSMDNYTVEHN
jgi:hypothetical protein